ncbi:MAG: ribonuclease [Firmicutes bacterium]|nr:ribonuclease [Bacillota bacterium]
MNKKIGILLILCLLTAALLTACSVPDLLEAVDQAEEYLAAQEESQTEESAAAESPAAENTTDESQSEPAPAAEPSEATVSENGRYSDPVSVALYLHTYGHLPDNYLTKSEAEALGWSNSLGNLWDVAPGCSIGGDKFGNREGLLPKAKGRQYYECDVNFDGGYRGGERIVYSNDGLIFYTADHYSSYTQLY